MSTLEPDKTVFVIYVGIRMVPGATEAHSVWLRLPDDWQDKRRPTDAEDVTADLPVMRFSTKRKVLKGLIIGYVYALPMNGDTAFFGPKVKRLREWPDREKRAEWCALDAASRETSEADAFTERESKRRVDLECLDPLRRAYERLSPRERAAMLTRVTRYLMTGR